LAASVVLAALAIGLYVSNKQKAAEAAKPASTDTNPKILALNDADIRQIELKKKGADATVLSRQNGKWQLTAPQTYGADQDTANQLASAAANVSSDSVVEQKAADLANYGLDAPALEVDLTMKDGKSKELLIGQDVPAIGGAYAMLQGDPRVFTVGSFVKTSLDKSVNDLRDKRLLTFDQDKVSRLELASKKQNIEFGRSKDEWQILKPQPMRADGLQVEELVRKIKDAKMDLTISADDAKKAAVNFASGTPVATVKVTDPSGAQQLEVRKNKDDYYAKSSAVEGVYKVTSELGTGLDKSVDDFRNKKLFDFGFSDPNKIEMHDGSKTYALQKTAEDWTQSGKKMDNTSVQNLIDKLRELSATKFVDSGFANPTIDVTVTSNDGKRVEKVLIAKHDSDYIAQRENEPSLYQLDSKTVDELTRAASDIKPAPPPAKK
jgi:hypothetical protein